MGDGKTLLATGEEDVDDIPDLVKNLDESPKNETNWTEFSVQLKRDNNSELLFYLMPFLKTSDFSFVILKKMIWNI